MSFVDAFFTASEDTSRLCLVWLRTVDGALSVYSPEYDCFDYRTSSQLNFSVAAGTYVNQVMETEISPTGDSICAAVAGLDYGPSYPSAFSACVNGRQNTTSLFTYTDEIYSAPVLDMATALISSPAPYFFIAVLRGAPTTTGPAPHMNFSIYPMTTDLYPSRIYFEYLPGNITDIRLLTTPDQSKIIRVCAFENQTWLLDTYSAAQLPTIQSSRRTFTGSIYNLHVTTDSNYLCSIALSDIGGRLLHSLMCTSLADGSSNNFQVSGHLNPQTYAFLDVGLYNGVSSMCTWFATSPNATISGKIACVRYEGFFNNISTPIDVPWNPYNAMEMFSTIPVLCATMENSTGLMYGCFNFETRATILTVRPLATDLQMSILKHSTYVLLSLCLCMSQVWSYPS